MLIYALFRTIPFSQRPKQAKFQFHDLINKKINCVFVQLMWRDIKVGNRPILGLMWSKILWHPQHKPIQD